MSIRQLLGSMRERLSGSAWGNKITVNGKKVDTGVQPLADELMAVTGDDNPIPLTAPVKLYNTQDLGPALIIQNANPSNPNGIQFQDSNGRTVANYGPKGMTIYDPVNPNPGVGIGGDGGGTGKSITIPPENWDGGDTGIPTDNWPQDPSVPNPSQTPNPVNGRDGKDGTGGIFPSWLIVVGGDWPVIDDTTGRPYSPAPKCKPVTVNFVAQEAEADGTVLLEAMDEKGNATGKMFNASTAGIVGSIAAGAAVSGVVDCHNRTPKISGGYGGVTGTVTYIKTIASVTVNADCTISFGVTTGTIRVVKGLVVEIT